MSPHCTKTSPENKCNLEGRNFKKSLSSRTAISAHFWWKNTSKIPTSSFAGVSGSFAFFFPMISAGFSTFSDANKCFFFVQNKTKPFTPKSPPFYAKLQLPWKFDPIVPSFLDAKLEYEALPLNWVIHHNGLRIWKWVWMSNWNMLLSFPRLWYFNAFFPQVMSYKGDQYGGYQYSPMSFGE